MIATAGLDLARERARAGAAWLDAHRPGWDDSVDLCELDLADGGSCVLGQVFETEACHFDAEDGFSWALSEYADLSDNFVELGFDDDSSSRVSYVLLDEAWAELIEARREQRREQRAAYDSYRENIEFAELSEAFDALAEAADELVELRDDTPRILTYSDIVAALRSETTQEAVRS